MLKVKYLEKYVYPHISSLIYLCLNLKNSQDTIKRVLRYFAFQSNISLATPHFYFIE